MVTNASLDEAMVADHKNGLTHEQIGAKYNVSRWAVQRRLKKISEATSVTGPVTPVPGLGLPVFTFTSSKGKVEVPTTVEEAVEVWNTFLDYKGKPAIAPQVASNPKEKKIVVINDIHAPFEDKEAIAALIAEHAHDTDLLIIGGDLLDLFSVSRYEKYDQHYSLSEEFRAGKAVLNLLASKFRKIKILPGNHDERWKKHLVGKRGMGPSEIQALSLLAQIATGDNEFDMTDPIYCLSRDLPNVEVCKAVVKDFAKFTFFMQEGDMIVSHAEKFSRMTGQTAAQAAQWFKSCAIPSGICDDFRVYVQTHNHQASWAWGNFGVWNLEVGCMCLTPDYAGSPKLMGAQRPSIVGYSVFYQDENGRTDMRRSRFIPLHG